MLTISNPYEMRQRSWTLTIVIWSTLAASVLLTIYNLHFADPISMISFSSLDIICLIALVLCYQGHYIPAAALLSLAVLMVITFNNFDGDGLFDTGVVAYPIFIILGTLLFGKRSVIGFTFSSIISLLCIGYLQSRGMIDVSVSARDTSNVIPLLILIFVSGLITWVITANMEKNLAQIQRSESDLREAYEMTLYGWAKALEYRDKETEGHSLRVVDLSQRLARMLGCSAEEIVNIRRGAILHDIGKMGIPDHILLKPAALNSQEWEIMRQHPQYGKDMLNDIHFLRPAMTIIYNHHERWDGCGYPRGLKGKEIPLSARIFAIVDNWDALSYDRPYRAAWSPEKVNEYIQQNAGKIFDPEIVDVFLKMDKSALAG